MRHALHLAGLSLLAITLFATTRTAAAASPADEYRAAMGPFTVDIEAWGQKVDQAARDALAGGANDEQLAELARIAGWMADDLDGTARLAPTQIATAHEQLTASVVRLGDAATVARTNPEKATLTIEQEFPTFMSALEQVRAFSATTPAVKGPGIDPVSNR